MANESARLCFGCMSPLGEELVCPRCGYDENAGYDRRYLRPGSKLAEGRYLVGKFMRKNGEGAIYLGYDFRMRERCWIKEYFPTSIARRDLLTGAVLPVDGYEAQYKALTSDFVDICNEVKRLGVTERVIPIRDVVFANSTVYAVYEKPTMISFDTYLQRNGGKLPLAKARELLLPFCHMVSCIHDHGFIHRGISPYTVYIDEDEHLYLWDFSLSATRTANSELEAELFNGYSAPEQYSSSGWQGAWTDVYAIAALFYRAVSGFVPPKSTLVGDNRPLATLEDLVLNMPHHISEAVEEAMALSAEARTQTVYAFTAKLIETETSGTAVYDAAQTKKLSQRQERKRESVRGFKYLVLALFFTVLVLVGGLWLIVTTYLPGMVQPSVSSGRSSSRSSESAEEPPPESETEREEPSAPEIDAKVPSFIGKRVSDVQDDSAYEGRFKFSVKEEYNKEVPEGTIYDQSPKEDTLMPNQGTVILYVSKGAELIEMPDIIGKPYDEALQILGDNDPPLACIKIDRYVKDATPGDVVLTSPAAGEKFDPDKQTISVYVMPEDNVADASNASGSKSSSSNNGAIRR